MAKRKRLNVANLGHYAIKKGRHIRDAARSILGSLTSGNGSGRDSRRSSASFESSDVVIESPSVEIDASDASPGHLLSSTRPTAHPSDGYRISCSAEPPSQANQTCELESSNPFNDPPEPEISFFTESCPFSESVAFASTDLHTIPDSASPDNVSEISRIGSDLFEQPESDLGTSELFVLEDDEAEDIAFAQKQRRTGVFSFPPSLESVESAVADLDALLKPPHKTTTFIRCQKADPTGKHWMSASLSVAQGRVKLTGKGQDRAQNLRTWLRNFIEDRTNLPVSGTKGGSAGKAHLDDEDLVAEILVHLQSKGKYVRAQDIVDYLSTPEMLQRLHRTKPIELRTAQRWMNSKLGYRWRTKYVGQYADGHERWDVVWYREKVFVPKMKSLYSQTRQWNESFVTEADGIVTRRGPRLVIWFHDESIFYANDRRQARWVHKTESAVPYTKGEGYSLMIADFISADYGFLASPDGTRSARRVFRPGKNRDGYFVSDDILDQAREAMDILKEFYPDDDHILIYDNAPSHLKRAETALSAVKMPKNPSSNFGVETRVIGSDGKPVHGPDGKILKQKIRMGNAQFRDGSPQELYFPDDHALAGQFKGIAELLTERRIDVTGKKLQCKSAFSDCPPNETSCCCRRILYCEPDFANVKTLLEELCEPRGFPIIFLPKFHCELNPIEQVWGYAKRLYRLNPPSTKEDVLERNTLRALDQVPLVTMRRFAHRSRKFLEAYHQGLNGQQAAWCAKKYRGHRVIPTSIINALLGGVDTEELERIPRH